MQHQVDRGRQHRHPRVLVADETDQQHQAHADQRAHVGREIQYRHQRAPQQGLGQWHVQGEQDAGEQQAHQRVDHADGQHVARDFAFDGMQDIHGELLLLPPGQQGDGVALQLFAIDHEEERQQHHRQYRSEQAWRGGQYLVGVVHLGAHHLHALGAFTPGGAGDVLCGQVGVLHGLGQLPQLGGQFAQFLGHVAEPVTGRHHQLIAQYHCAGDTAHHQHQCRHETRHMQALQETDDGIADQGEEHAQQDRQQQVLRCPQRVADRQRGQYQQGVRGAWAARGGDFRAGVSGRSIAGGRVQGRCSRKVGKLRRMKAQP